MNSSTLSFGINNNKISLLQFLIFKPIYIFNLIRNTGIINYIRKSQHVVSKLTILQYINKYALIFRITEPQYF